MNAVTKTQKAGEDSSSGFELTNEEGARESFGHSDDLSALVPHHNRATSRLNWILLNY